MNVCAHVSGAREAGWLPARVRWVAKTPPAPCAHLCPPPAAAAPPPTPPPTSTHPGSDHVSLAQRRAKELGVEALNDLLGGAHLIQPDVRVEADVLHVVQARRGGVGVRGAAPHARGHACTHKRTRKRSTGATTTSRLPSSGLPKRRSISVPPRSERVARCARVWREGGREGRRNSGGWEGQVPPESSGASALPVGAAARTTNPCCPLHQAPAIETGVSSQPPATLKL